MNKKTAPKPKNKPPAHPLKGKFFHTWENDVVGWQGVVIDVLPGNKLYVQLFSWIMGEPYEQKIIPVNQTTWNEKTKTGWSFYDYIEEWMYRYDRYHERMEMQRREAESSTNSTGVTRRSSAASSTNSTFPQGVTEGQ